MKPKNLIAIYMIITITALSSCLSQQASFQGLGYLPGGIFESSARSVSSDGSVVVGSGTTAGTQAFRWTKKEGMVSLGNLPDSSYKNSWPYSVSADGSIVVGSGDPGAGWSAYKGFVWKQGTGMIEFGSLDGSKRFEAFGVSADGSIVVGDGGQQAFQWTQSGGIIGLGVLPGRTNSRAVSISADGRVISGSSYNLPSWDNEEAFYWTQKEGIVGLGFLPGSHYSFPNAVSSDGSVIVGTSSDSTGYPAFRWTKSTGMVKIGSLPGLPTAHPFGVTANGKIIVGGSFNGPADGKAFIWDSSHGMRELQKVLQSDNGLDPAGWNLKAAFGISPDGNVIVGQGQNPAGKLEAFIVVLDTTRLRR